MVLDLVVQAAEHHVGETAVPCVAGSQHLTAQEVRAVGAAQHRHAFVVRGKFERGQTPKRH
ncbi:hypothetical protein [Streptomyces avidinii]|uniref:Uncharacterized protein n=1 Tax=Streptomyces avidinii TaxID=1895 RepID=A0ABS4KZ85_STRAV|nr:hypothetical protein [Streptomyces avidinii]